MVKVRLRKSADAEGIVEENTSVLMINKINFVCSQGQFEQSLLLKGQRGKF